MVIKDDEAVDILIQETLHILRSLSIKQAKGYMYVNEVAMDYNDINKMMRSIKRYPVMFLVRKNFYGETPFLNIIKDKGKTIAMLQKAGGKLKINLNTTKEIAQDLQEKIENTGINSYQILSKTYLHLHLAL